MIWRLRSRSRTICLSLALACASLYLLLLLLASRPLRLRPCRSPPPPQTRFLTGGNVSSVAVKEPADASSGDASGKKSFTGGRPPHGGASYRTEPPETAEAGRAKLEALFNHPLYNWPHLPIPEEDLLLRVRAKVTSSGRSPQMWSVIKKDECWEKLHLSVHLPRPLLALPGGATAWRTGTGTVTGTSPGVAAAAAALPGYASTWASPAGNSTPTPTPTWLRSCSSWPHTESSARVCDRPLPACFAFFFPFFSCLFLLGVQQIADSL